MSKTADRVSEKLLSLPPIRTLGLYQPYATLMMPPYNKIETRWVKAGKKPPFPLGQYLIYSTKKAYPTKEVKEISGGYYEEVRKNIIAESIRTSPAYPNRHGVRWINADGSVEFLNGHALCIGELVELKTYSPVLGIGSFVEMHPDAHYTADFDSNEPDQGEFVVDNYVLWCLIFDNMKRIDPFPFKGKQGVGLLSFADREKIKYID